MFTVGVSTTQTDNTTKDVYRVPYYQKQNKSKTSKTKMSTQLMKKHTN